MDTELVESCWRASSSVPPSLQVHLAMVAPHTQGVADNGHYVTVVDLSPLLVSPPKSSKGGATSQLRGAVPTKIDELDACRPQFCLMVTVWLFSLAMDIQSRFSSLILLRLSSFLHARFSMKVVGASSSGFEFEDVDCKSATQLYNLHRGHTAAVVESFNWVKDGRWVMVGTPNRMVHVFV